VAPPNRIHGGERQGLHPIDAVRAELSKVSKLLERGALEDRWHQISILSAVAWNADGPMGHSSMLRLSSILHQISSLLGRLHNGYSQVQHSLTHVSWPEFGFMLIERFGKDQFEYLLRKLLHIRQYASGST
jgi:hypothetical protein